MTNEDNVSPLDGFCNVRHIIPIEGMHVELRDPDFIWSTATIVNVQKEKPKPTNLSTTETVFVVLRYDGWGNEWNETLPWPHPRIAKLFTYTKRARCMLNIQTASSASSRNKKRANNLLSWPCCVQFRMPHPSSKHAEQLLRLEMNVFVEPYGNTIPKEVLLWFPNGKNGGWINRNRLRQWRHVINEEQTESSFEEAWKIAEYARIDNLPLKAFETGTLLNKIYRVHEEGGGNKSDIMYQGGFGNLTCYSSSRKGETNSIMKIMTKNNSYSSDSQESSEDEYNPPAVEPPPLLPPPMKIMGSIHKSVKRFKNSNQWGSVIKVNGNDIFIGPFPTQTQAIQMKDLAEKEYSRQISSPRSKKEKNMEMRKYQNELIQNIEKAREMDVKAISLESCISTFENEWKPSNNFSMHDWTMQAILYDDYMFEKKNGEVLFEKRKKMQKETRYKRLKKRKQAHPRKVDLEKSCYFT